MPRNTKPLPDPATHQLVMEYDAGFVGDSRYSTAEATLDTVFQDYPSNTDMPSILIKACTLNALYSTNINAIYRAAERIQGKGSA
jgi:hypothetical protein